MKITINDLIGSRKEYNENPVALTIKSDIFEAEKQREKELNKKVDFREKIISNEEKQFFDIQPINDFERSLLASKSSSRIDSVLKMRKKDFAEKARENRILAEYDAKMHRIKKIKSKNYRRMRRKELNKKTQDILSDSDSIEEEENIKTDITNNEIDFDEKKRRIPKNMLEIHDTENEKHKKVNKEDEECGIVKKLLDRAELESKKEKKFNNVFSFSGKKTEDFNQREFVSKLFSSKKDDETINQDNEFNQNFLEKKEAIIIKDLPEQSVTVLPGWGTWGGTDIEIVETKYNKIVKNVEGVSFKDRKDKGLSHVIINSKIDTNPNLDKYKSDLPHGITKEQYKKKINQLLPKEEKILKIFNKFVKADKNEQETFVYDPKYK